MLAVKKMNRKERRLHMFCSYKGCTMPAKWFVEGEAYCEEHMQYLCSKL